MAAFVIASLGTTPSGAANGSSELTATAAPVNSESANSQRSRPNAGLSYWAAGTHEAGSDLTSGAALAAVAAPERCPSARKAIRFYSSRIAFWYNRMGAAPARARSGISCPRYLARILQRKAYGLRKAYAKVAAERRARYRRLYEKWRCIHEHEGAWNSNTGNGYWGGLQMDWGFQHTYGPEFIRRWGLAHRWPVWAQLEAAERAYHGFAGYGGRGYSPWGTRGMCGL